MSPSKAPKATISPAKANVKKAPKGSAQPKKASKSLPSSQSQGFFLWQGVIDLSIEARPIVRPFEPGERQLDYAVQTQHAVMPQGSASQLVVRLRATISMEDISIVIAEIHYSGIAEKALSAAEAELGYNLLYPAARAALMAGLHLVGHAPPLPEQLVMPQQ